MEGPIYGKLDLYLQVHDPAHSGIKLDMQADVLTGATEYTNFTKALTNIVLIFIILV